MAYFTLVRASEDAVNESNPQRKKKEKKRQSPKMLDRRRIYDVKWDDVSYDYTANV